MIVGYTMLHYGMDYLATALKALEPYVERHIVIYSPMPSFGVHTYRECPDKRDDLHDIAQSVLGNKLAWIEGITQNYASVMQLFPSTELILETDADEVWPEALVLAAILDFQNGFLDAQRYRMPMIHHWRSFDHICRDQGWPIRMFVPGGTGERYSNYSNRPIHHFGYARSVQDTTYKIETSAHRGEWRSEWLETKFLPWSPQNGPFEDLHPVMRDFWKAEHYDKSQLPPSLHDHPYFNCEVIA